MGDRGCGGGRAGEEDGRYAVVRLPVVTRAWREYVVNWVQLDARAAELNRIGEGDRAVFYLRKV